MQHVVYLIHVLLIYLLPVVSRHKALLLCERRLFIHVELDAATVIKAASVLLVTPSVGFAHLGLALTVLGLLWLHVIVDFIRLAEARVVFLDLVAQAELFLLNGLHSW